MSYLQGVMLGAVLSLLAMVFAYLAGKMGEATIDGREEADFAEKRLPKRALLESRLELRRAELQAELTALGTEVQTQRRRRFVLEKDLQDARREAESPIRLVGREGVGLRFLAWMINRQVQGAQAEGKQHGTLDPDWANPQIVEVWADNLEDARKEVARIYPIPLGFTVLNIRLDAAEADKLEREAV
ncbi:MAG TPA: hypothetical protein VEB20_02105 [Azospirillaceae bacterium]|nr:hypothetical protein [Azospirillaceae bacterium]